MGPRSDNRGYVSALRRRQICLSPLQWVHGRITVVMEASLFSSARFSRLQWVHGRITVVMGLIRQRGDGAHEGFNGSTVG